MQNRLRVRSDWMRRVFLAQQEVYKHVLLGVVHDQTLRACIREHFMSALAQTSRNSTRVRIRNRCIWTGRSRGILKQYRCSRIVFRELAAQGRVVGVQKSSW